MVSFVYAVKDGLGAASCRSIRAFIASDHVRTLKCLWNTSALVRIVVGRRDGGIRLDQVIRVEDVGECVYVVCDIVTVVANWFVLVLVEIKTLSYIVSPSL